MDRRSLAVCAIFKNEAPYLLEWIAYHRVIGFDRFVLYDNASTDGGADLVRRSPLTDCATVIHWPQRPGQLSAYRHFIDIFAPAHDWAAFIDLDEFILPLGGNSLADTLQRCQHAAAVLANWRVFGPAGREEPAPGLVTEAYDLRAEDSLPVNRHVKSIVRCSELLDVTENPHEFRVKGPVCNPLGQEVPNVGLQPAACHQGLVINHYYTRSRREWLAKIHRGSAMFDYAEPKYTEDVFEHLAAACTVKDDSIKAYLPQTRALMGIAPQMDTPAPTPVSAEPPGPPNAAPAGAAAGAAAEAPPIGAPPAGAPPASSAVQPAGLPTATATATAGAPGNGAPFAPPPADSMMPGTIIPSQAAGAPVPNPVPQQTPAAPPPSGWIDRGADAQEHTRGLALVFRDRSRPGAPWLAALRGDAAGLIDPDFLLDDAGRLRDFADDEAARAACEATLAEYQLV